MGCHALRMQARTKTGRFGVGFNSSYHVTDLPCFASRRYVVLLDPHCSSLPNVSRKSHDVAASASAHSELRCHAGLALRAWQDAQLSTKQYVPPPSRTLPSVGQPLMFRIRVTIGCGLGSDSASASASTATRGTIRGGATREVGAHQAMGDSRLRLEGMLYWWGVWVT